MLLLKVVLCRTFLGLFRITYTAVVVEVVLVFSVNGFIKQVVFSMMILQELVRVGLEKSRAVNDDRDINDLGLSIFHRFKVLEYRYNGN